jgi:hypothetical protein
MAAVFPHVLALALELARVVPRMASWLHLLPSGEPYGEVTALPDAGQGIGRSFDPCMVCTVH